MNTSPILVSRWYQVMDYKIHVRTLDVLDDSKYNIVLVHGLGISSSYMLPLARELLNTYNVYAPDLPGHGKSPNAKNPLNIQEFADVLASWIRRADVQKPVFIGNSMGCQIIAELCSRYKEMASAAVLVGPTVDPRAKGLREQARRFAKNGRNEPFSMNFVAFKDYARCGVKLMKKEVEFVLEDAVEEKLPKVLVPTLVVRGEKDLIVPLEWAKQATELLPKGRLSIIPGAAHVVNYSHPKELAQVMNNFLQVL